MRIAFIAVAALGVGCGSSGGSEESAAGLTYYEHVAPILEAKCAGCHRDGGIAPFPLTTYEEVVAVASAIPPALESGYMPPWPPDPNCNEYRYDRSLAADLKDQVLDWIDNGVKEGDPAVVPQAVEATELVQLERVDHTLALETGYLPSRYPDDYRCFVFEWPEAVTSFVTGYEIIPDKEAQVHHLLAYLAPASSKDHYQALDDAEEGPGYTCFGGTEGPLSGGLGGWAPGTGATMLPAGTGLEVEPGSLVILQMHYNTLFVDPEPDRTRFEAQVEATVERPAIFQPWINPDWLDGDTMAIPAGDDSVVHSFAFPPTQFWDRITGGKIPDGAEIEILAASHHMHLLGKRARFDVIGADTTCLLDIPKWDFDWQGSYMFKEPVRLKDGQLLSIECEWDNSAANQPDLGGGTQPPRNLAWGEGSTDEMCFGSLLITQAID